MEIRILLPDDLTNGFLETLSSLKEIDLKPEEALNVYWTRGSHVKTYVALEDGKVVGTASLIVERKFIHNGSFVGHIEDVAVLKEKQGSGIGSKLVEFLIKQSKDYGCYKVILNCDESLIEYYSKLGFRTWTTGMRIDLNN